MKSNTNELRTQLKSILRESCANTCYQETKSPKEYPYVIFDLSEIQQSCGRTQYKLEVNCVCKNNADAESLADNIQDTLDQYSYMNKKIAFYIYRNQRNTVYEEDKTIKRRRLIFELYFYSREE